MSQPIVLFPTDFSAASDAALEHAVSLARDMQARLLIVHVRIPYADFSYAGAPEEYGQRLPAELAQRLETLSAGATAVPYEYRTVSGEPARAIAAQAREERVALIVMGTTGRSGLRRLLLGSVADAVLRAAPCPVLTFKGTPGEAKAESADAGPQLVPIESLPPAAGQPTLRGESLGIEPHTDVPAAIGLLWRAIHARASDVHIDEAEGEFEIRFRIDGRLERFCRLDHEVGQPLINQLKVLSNLDIANPFRPQEGRMELPESLRGFEVRVTSVPVAGGEAISLRLLDRSRLLRPLDTLGFSAAATQLVHQMLQLGEGLVLVTGPSGSGKTTTLYSMLHALDNGRRNIVTIEDPVEFTEPKFRQLGIDLRHDLTMTRGMRALLRMDPDVVMIGEVRDAEAAEIAMRAASSGKYVFTTLHTRDVASTVTALRDLHIDSRSLGSNLTGIISQRLVRRLCQECCQSGPLDAQAQSLFAAHQIEPPDSIRRAVGCAHCRGTGYLDRVVVAEIVLPSEEVIAAIEAGDAEDHLRHLLRAQGTHSLMADGLAKVSQGITSLEEIQSMTWIEFVDRAEQIAQRQTAGGAS